MNRKHSLWAALAFCALAAGATGAPPQKGDADSGPALRKLTFVHRVVYSPDGKSLLVEYHNPPGYQSPSAVGVWDVETGKFRVGMEKPPQHCEQIALSLDGKKAAAVSAGDRVLEVWEVATGKKVQEFELPPWKQFTPAAPFLAFSPDGTILTSVLKQKILRAKLGGEAKVLPDELERWSTEMISYSPATDVLVHAVNPPIGKKSGGKIQAYDLAKGGAPQTVEPSGWVRSIALSPDGKTLVVSYERELNGPKSIPGKVELWDPASWKPTETLPQDKRKDFWSYRSLSFSPDGKLLVGSPSFGVKSAIAVEFLDLKGTLFREVTESKQLLNDVAFSPDDKTAAVVLGMKPILFLDPTKGKDKGP